MNPRWRHPGGGPVNRWDGRIAYRDPDGPEALGTLIGHTHGGIHCCGCNPETFTSGGQVVYALRLDDGRAVWAAPHLVRRLGINRKAAA